MLDKTAKEQVDMLSDPMGRVGTRQRLKGAAMVVDGTAAVFDGSWRYGGGV